MNHPPSVGRIVHYVSQSAPAGQDTTRCLAAVVTEVQLGVPVGMGSDRVGLAVLGPTEIILVSLAVGGCRYDDGAERPGSPDCPEPHSGGPFRYCACGWMEASFTVGTWHWPERVG